MSAEMFVLEVGNMKKLAPIIVTIIVCAWIAVYTAGMIIAAKSETSLIGNILLFSVAIISGGTFFAMIWTLIIRLREINKEEKEDDISKY